MPARDLFLAESEGCFFVISKPPLTETEMSRIDSPMPLPNKKNLHRPDLYSVNQAGWPYANIVLSHAGVQVIGVDKDVFREDPAAFVDWSQQLADTLQATVLHPILDKLNVNEHLPTF